MDPLGRNHSLNSQANLNGSELRRGKDFSKNVAETDENEFRLLPDGALTKSQVLKKDLKKNASFSNTSFSFKKKILAERKEDLLPDSSLSSNLEITPQSKCMPCADPSGASFHKPDISLHSYDPITNYTSPRPKFLRYNPNQRRELLQRIEGEKRGDEEVRTAFSPSSPKSSSKRENDDDNEDEGEEELEEEKPWYLCVVWSLFLIFGVFLFISYCMRSNFQPSFEGFESSAANIQKIQGMAPVRSVGKGLFFEKILESLVSFSQMCPIVRESVCNLDETLFVSLEIDGFIGRKRPGERELLMEEIRNVFSDKTEVVAKDEGLLLNNGGLVDDETVVKEQREHGDQNQRDSGSLAEEANSKKSMSRDLTLKENNITRSSVESLLVSLSQEISDSSFTIREDKFHNESFDSMEFPWTSQSRVDASTPTDDQGLEDFSFALAYDTKLSDYSSNILSEVALRTFSIFLGSLTIVVGLLSCFYKYYRRPNLNFPFLPSSGFYKKKETRQETVQKKEENLVDKALNILAESKSSAVPSPLDDVNVELKEVSGFAPPSVELLGEFSLIDAEANNNGFGSNLKKMEYPNSQFCYHKKRRAREKLSPSAAMLVSSPEESTSSRFSSKVPVGEGERSDTSATSSLRRSSRLQNRNRNRVI